MVKHGFSRRSVSKVAGGLVGAIAVGGRDGLAVLARQAVTPASPAAGSAFAPQVDAGLACFQRRAADQLPLVVALRDAIVGGDPEAEKLAYVASRPPFEPGSVAAMPYSRVPVETRARIVAASYALRDSLVAAHEALGV